MGKRILYCIPRSVYFDQFKGVGGHVSHALGMIDAFVRSGHEVTLLSGDRPASPGDDICYLEVDNKHARSRIGRILWNRRYTARVEQVLREKPFDLIYMRYSAGFLMNLPGLKKRLPPNLPLVLEVNSFASQRFAFLSILEKRALQSADIIVCPTSGLIDHISGMLNANNRPKFLHLANAVDINRFSSGKTKIENTQNSPLLIGYLGIFKGNNYGLDTLVEAVKRLTDKHKHFECHFIGTGPYLDELRDSASACDQIKILDPCSREEVPSVLNHYDILVHTTKESYMSPIKLFEYMASEKAIVASDTPAVRSVLSDGDSGLLYNPQSSEELADKLEILLTNASLRKQLACKAREEVLTHHTWKHRANTLFENL